MIELLILWNVAALREDIRDEQDRGFALIAAWVVLQILLWPISLFVIMCRWFRWRIWVSLIAASAFTGLGYLAWGDNFYFLLGCFFVGAAAVAVAWGILSAEDA